MSYRLAPTPMILKGLYGPEAHSPIASFFRWHFSYHFAVYKISTDIAWSRGPFVYTLHRTRDIRI